VLSEQIAPSLLGLPCQVQGIGPGVGGRRLVPGAVGDSDLLAVRAGFDACDAGDGLGWAVAFHVLEGVGVGAAHAKRGRMVAHVCVHGGLGQASGLVLVQPVGKVVEGEEQGVDGFLRVDVAAGIDPLVLLAQAGEVAPDDVPLVGPAGFLVVSRS
jgi:hypothetical protein